MKPKILLFDIENAPGTAYIWQLKNDYIDPRMIKDNWYMLCWAAKWLGDKNIMSSALCDHKGYNPLKPCDKMVLTDLWKLLDEADIVIAHNGKKFDVKKSNARFIKYGMEPPSPYKVIDTLTEARKSFMFMSNRLNELGKILGVGKKLRTGGFDLWEDVMHGDLKAWKKMVRYCKQDVRLLEKVYLKLRPYMRVHPDVSTKAEIKPCANCGSYDLRKKSVRQNISHVSQVLRCHDCGKCTTTIVSGRKFKKILPVCPRCGNNSLKKNSKIYLAGGISQGYRCRKCGGNVRKKIRTYTEEEKAIMCKND